MIQTVDLEPLSTRIFLKYFKYIDDKVKQRTQERLVPKSRQELVTAQSNSDLHNESTDKANTTTIT